MSSLLTAGERQDPWTLLGDALRRVARLEAVPPGTDLGQVIRGAILNDGSVIEGTGFTAQWSDASGWSNVTPYVPGDITNSGGSSYVCVLANTNQAPPNVTYWTAISSSATNAYSVVFNTPFANPPIVLLTPNNDNAPAAKGRYTTTLVVRTVGYIVVLTANVDDPDSLGPQDGGFDFLAIAPVVAP